MFGRNRLTSHGPALAAGGAGSRTPVAVLGATGIVGQRLVRLLDRHPHFKTAEVFASSRSAGAHYGGVVRWAVGGDPPGRTAQLVLRPVGDPVSSPVVLSALPAKVARGLEVQLAGEGKIVCTNASAHRLDPRVPLIVPDVNPAALAVVRDQPWFANGGALVANPNCNVAGVAVALAPLERELGIVTATIVTLQALSGAALDGVGAVQIAGNVVPWIGGEEEKLGPELNKVLGSRIVVASAVNRVPVVDGHTAHVFLKLRKPATAERAEDLLGHSRPPEASRALPSLPECPITVRNEPDRPQPRLDADVAGGMGVSVGRVRPAPRPHDLAFVVTSHNGVRGAAGICLANAELCLAGGLLSSGR